MIDNKKSVEGRKSRRMGPGTHVMCKVTDKEIKETPSGKSLLEIWFTNPRGESQKKTIWFPDSSPKPRDGESNEAAKEREINRFTGEITDILIAFFSEEEAVLSASTPLDFAKKAIAKLTSIPSGKFCNILVQYDIDYKYTEIPKYGWIQPYVEGQPATLRITEKTRLTPPTQKPNKSEEASRYY